MELNEKYDVIVGLEIHIQTNTKSKMFCSCPTDYFQKEPNTHVCPVCLGLPGALPVPNKRAIELCILMGLATKCSIANEIFFDRKHYFYPDLPKGYQISQYKKPICSNGFVEVPSGLKVEIERIHQEEDVAKSTHHTESSTGKEYTLVDYNKSGVPLIEIVTKPSIRSAKDAKDFATKIRQIARYLNISNADMEKGQMRCEPNISIQEKGKWEYKDGKILPLGDYKLNPKAEVKNIGSITAVEKAIEYEVKRMADELEEGKPLKQQTRGWNASKNITEFQRYKETADDYRYMPEPDIPVIEISNEDIKNISKELVELPNEKIKRYISDWGITEYSAEVISSTKKSADFFENLQLILSKKIGEKEAAKEASNWIMGPLYAIANKKGKDFSEIGVNSEDFAELIIAFKDGMFTKNKAEEILNESIDKGINVSEEIQKLKSVKDSNGSLTEVVKRVIEENIQAVTDYKNGKEASIGFLVGKVMQITKGTSNPNDVRNTLVEELKK
ncbi:MAG TPA: Asp-tRNA(Asn)/Glu-tRNA(Gln) amidotransferase subunit GatB [Candidatus Dojkabacteria bacterium]|nr:Asp-tRNA(Asn)/Glu-tRNA(Gln) amidotransferase subunit GatB [Candidatus Dojkabacteria bacterium]